MNAGTNFAEEFPLNRMSDTTNISSGNNATMLILSPCIYAKKSSNAFYSGNIQNKLPDGSYLVKFTDGSIESVEERDIMWLGFWGLPPSTWPQTPLVHSVGAINMEFPKGLVQNDNANGPTSHSVPLKNPSREGDVAADKQGNEFSELGMKYDVSVPSEMRQNAGEISSFEAVNSAHRMPRQQCQWPENQARCVVSCRIVFEKFAYQSTQKKRPVDISFDRDSGIFKMFKMFSNRLFYKKIIQL